MDEKSKMMQKLYPVGSILEGEVYMLTPFGIFLKINHPEFLGLIEIVHVTDDDGIFDYSLYPPLTSKIIARVIGHRPENSQVYLSIKPSVLQNMNVHKS